jgi:galactofuranose transport system ATP-binding protein
VAAAHFRRGAGKNRQEIHCGPEDRGGRHAVATPIKLLSGGNQQKALLARWLATEPRLLILDEPTRGIDVGAKFEIAAFWKSLCRNGMGLLFISSELEEVARFSHRVLVLRDRKVIGHLEGENVSEHNIMSRSPEASRL